MAPQRPRATRWPLTIRNPSYTKPRDSAGHGRFRSTVRSPFALPKPFSPPFNDSGRVPLRSDTTGFPRSLWWAIGGQPTGTIRHERGRPGVSRVPGERLNGKHAGQTHLTNGMACRGSGVRVPSAPLERRRSAPCGGHESSRRRRQVANPVANPAWLVKADRRWTGPASSPQLGFVVGIGVRSVRLCLLICV
jgi:hypothetical protein